MVVEFLNLLFSRSFSARTSVESFESFVSSFSGFSVVSAAGLGSFGLWSLSPSGFAVGLLLSAVAMLGVPSKNQTINARDQVIRIDLLSPRAGKCDAVIDHISKLENGNCMIDQFGIQRDWVNLA